MTSPNIEQLLDIHGADPARWPEAARAQLDTLDPARREAAARLDAWLDQSRPPPMSAALRTRVLAHCKDIAAQQQAARTGFWQSLWYSLGGARVAAPTFALALLAGIALGQGLEPLMPAETPTDETLWLSLGQLEDSYSELLP